MQNPIQSADTLDFWVWIDPLDWLTKHQVTSVGSFCSIFPTGNETLAFLPNPKFEGAIAIFQNNILTQYRTEYNLELCRQAYFSCLPSRLTCIFLFGSESDAYKYRERHPWHVDNRVLKKVKTTGLYRYTKHDSSWIDFLRLKASIEPATIDQITKAYWSGSKVEDQQLTFMTQPWTETALFEVLFIGRVDFYDRNL